jgi:hypothetical protein
MSWQTVTILKVAEVLGEPLQAAKTVLAEEVKNLLTLTKL